MAKKTRKKATTKRSRSSAEGAARTDEDRRKWIKEWQDSGLSQTEFAPKAGVTQTSFSHWVRRLAPELSTYGRRGGPRKKKTKKAASNAIASADVLAALFGDQCGAVADAKALRELLAKNPDVIVYRGRLYAPIE